MYDRPATLVLRKAHLSDHRDRALPPIIQPSKRHADGWAIVKALGCVAEDIDAVTAIGVPITQRLRRATDLNCDVIAGPLNGVDASFGRHIN